MEPLPLVRVQKYGRLKAQAGALFASLDIPGGVIVRRNKVHNVFNGVRMDVSSQMRAEPDMRGKLNTNVGGVRQRILLHARQRARTRI